MMSLFTSFTSSSRLLERINENTTPQDIDMSCAARLLDGAVRVRECLNEPCRYLQPELAMAMADRLAFGLNAIVGYIGGGQVSYEMDSIVNTKQGLMSYTADLDVRLRAFAKQINDGRAVYKAETLVMLQRSKSDMGKLRVALNELRVGVPVDAVPSGCCFHMDSLDSQSMAQLQIAADCMLPGSGAFVKPVLGAVMGMNHDAPSVVNGTWENIAQTNLPRLTTSLAFKKEDFVGSNFENFSQDPKVDITDILSRCKIPTRIRTIKWATTDVVGADLIPNALNNGIFPLGNTFVITPCQPIQQIAIVGNYAVEQYNTPLSYFADIFEYWRGDLEFTIEVLPTKFHQGQLMAVFVPGDATNKPTMNQARNCASVTLDLSTSNRTKFVVPFCSRYEYVRTFPGLGSPANPFNNYLAPRLSHITGALMIYVQNPLIAPPTVAQTVDINLYVAACDNFEFAVPIGSRTKQFINGDYHMAEIVKDSAVAIPAHLPPTGLNPKTNKQVAVDCNVVAASQETIMTKEYLLVTNIQWTTSDPYGKNILQAKLSDIFTSRNLSVVGLLEYHQFARMNFEVTFKLNASPFYCGMLKMYWTPRKLPPSIPGFYTGSFTQYPNADYCPASETEATLRIPWGSIRRLINIPELRASTEELGYVNICVFNELRAPATAQTTLTGTLWGHIIDPYVGFKIPDLAVTAVNIDAASFHGTNVDAAEFVPKTNTAPYFNGGGSFATNPEAPEVEKSASTGVLVEPTASMRNGGAKTNNEGPSDSAKATSTGGRLVKPLVRKPQCGYIRGNHMNVIDLLRRPSEVIAIPFTETAQNSPSFQRFLQLPLTGLGSVFDALRCLYFAWSGSVRLHVLTNISSINNVLFAITPEYANAIELPLAVSGPLNPEFLWNGASIWKPGEKVMHVIQQPYYSKNPCLQCPVADHGTIPALDEREFVSLTLSVQATEAFVGQAPTFIVTTFLSAGDDYQLYIPLHIPNTYFNSFAFQEEGRDEVDLLPVEALEGGDFHAQDFPEQIGFLEKELTLDMKAELDTLFDEIQFHLPNPIRGIQKIWEFITKWLTEQFSEPIEVQLKKRIREITNEAFVQIVPVLVWAVDFILNIYCIFTTADTAIRAMAVTSLTTKCIMSYKYGDNLLEQLNKIGSATYDAPDDEAFMSLPGIIATALVAGLISFLGYSFGKSSASALRDSAAYKFSEACAATGKIATGARSIPNLFLMAKSGVSAGVEYFLEGKKPFQDWFCDNKTELEAWQREVDQCNARSAFDSNNAFKYYLGVSNFTTLKRLAKTANEIRAKAGSVKNFPVVWSRTAETLLKDLARVQKAYDSCDSRMEPIGIYFYGQPGCGKSYISKEILPFLVMRRLGLVTTRAEVLRQVYSKPTDPEQKYMDGYTSQYWVNVDDFGAAVDDTDALEMITLISCAIRPVNMADVSEKKTTFDSKFVCATTNQKSVGSVMSVKDKSALSRRFPVAYDMKLRPAFSDHGKLNMPKFRALFKGQEMDDAAFLAILDTVWEFDGLDLNSGSVVRPHQCMSDIVEQITSLYNTRMSVDNDMAAFMSGFHMMRFPKFECRDEIRLDTFYEDAAACDDHIDGYTVAQVEWVMRVRKQQNEAELDYDTCQEILATLKADCLDYATSWRELCVNARSAIPMDPSRGTTNFYGVVAWLDAQRRPKRQDLVKKDWPGLVSWALKAVGVAVGASAIAYALYRMAKSTTESVMSTFHGPQYTGEKNYTKNAKAKAVRGRYHGPTLPMGGPMEKVRRNMRKIEVTRFATKIYWTCLALDSRTLIMPLHYYNAWAKIRKEDPDAMLKLEMVNSKRETKGYAPFHLGEPNTLQLSGHGMFGGKRDLVYVRLVGCNVDHARDLRSLIMTRKQIEGCCTSALKCGWLRPEGDALTAVVDFRKMVCKDSMYFLYAVASEPSEPGFCGRPYCVAQASCPRPLFGIHSLGIDMHQKSVGISPFDIEMITEADGILEDRLGVSVCIEEPEELLWGAEMHDQTNKFWTSKDMENHGSVSLNGERLCKHTPDRTAFMKTGLMHGEWEDLFEPSNMKVLEDATPPVHPLYTNAQKYDRKADRVVSINVYKIAVEEYKRRVGIAVEPRALLRHEMINGIGSMKPIVVNTSPGYLAAYYTNGKTELFDELEQEVHDGVVQPINYVYSKVAYERVIPIWKRTFVQHMDYCEAEIAQGRKLPTFWTATCKDELLKKEKVRRGKTRVFVQPGLDYTLLMRKYFGHFAEAMKNRAGSRLHHAIGTDKEVVWGQMWRMLQKVGKNGFDVDYSNYDGSVQIQAFDFFAEVTDHWYGDENRVQRHALLDSLRNSYMITGSLLIETSQGNNSGNPLTDIFNSVTNVFVVYTGYLVARSYRGLPLDLSSLDDDLVFFTYGDDIIASVSDDVQYWFNRETIKEHAEHIGMVVTAADKGSQLLKWEPLENLTFLKSHFVERPGYVASPLPTSVIYRELIWQRKTNDGDALILKQRIDTAVRMMAHHGKEKCEELIDQLKEMKVDVDFSFNAWEWEIREKQERDELEDASGLPNMEFIFADDDSESDMWDHVPEQDLIQIMMEDFPNEEPTLWTWSDNDMDTVPDASFHMENFNDDSDYETDFSGTNSSSSSDDDEGERDDGYSVQTELMAWQSAEHRELARLQNIAEEAYFQWWWIQVGVPERCIACIEVFPPWGRLIVAANFQRKILYILDRGWRGRFKAASMQLWLVWCAVRRLVQLMLH